jgi:hypothetical protein
LPCFAIPFQQNHAGGRRIIIPRKINAFCRCFKVNYQAVNEFGENLLQRKLKTGECPQMLMGLGDEPGRIASAAEITPLVYAGDTVKDPCGGNITGAAEKSQAILVDCA